MHAAFWRLVLVVCKRCTQCACAIINMEKNEKTLLKVKLHISAFSLAPMSIQKSISKIEIKFFITCTGFHANQIIYAVLEKRWLLLFDLKHACRYTKLSDNWQGLELWNRHYKPGGGTFKKTNQMKTSSLFGYSLCCRSLLMPGFFFGKEVPNKMLPFLHFLSSNRSDI